VVAPAAFINANKNVTVIGALYGDSVHLKAGSSIIGAPAVEIYFDLFIVPAFTPGD
jgi:hypothetical protein